MADLDTMQSLRTKVTDRGPYIRTLEAYYDGAQRLAAMGLSLPPEMRNLTVVVNWPRLVVDALEERIDLIAFRMHGAARSDDRLWSWWQANNLDEESSLTHLEAFVQGRAYVVVGFNEDDPSTPIITCESAKNMFADIDPRTNEVKSAVRLYDWSPEGEPRAATLYMPNYTVYYTYDRGRWTETDSIEHNYGVVPVVPMVNRARIADRHGRSEMHDIMQLTDACCRAMTNLQAAQELVAVPSRYVFGVTEADLKDNDGNPITKWQAYIGRINMLGNDQAKVTQLPASDLNNFATVMNIYAKQIASLTGLPPHYVGMSSDNPASADAIRSSEARHVKRAERKIKVFGGVWEQVMRLGMLVVDGSVPDDAKRMESVFRDPATPTYAAMVDAVTKLYAGGNGLLPKEAALEELSYTPEHIARILAMTEDPTDKLLRSLGADPTIDTSSTAPGRLAGAQLDQPTGDGTSPTSTGGVAR